MGNAPLPSQSLLMQLRDERGIIFEAYEFLDEKRMLLAAELLRQLEIFEELKRAYMALQEQAKMSLNSALGKHGLHGLQVYPAYDFHDREMAISKRHFMGVGLLETHLLPAASTVSVTPSMPSAEADHCRELFLELLESGTLLAGISGNMQRLSKEYQRTERRARALENVVIPELEQDLRKMTGQLEEQDQEETTRLHQKHG